MDRYRDNYRDRNRESSEKERERERDRKDASGWEKRERDGKRERQAEIPKDRRSIERQSERSNRERDDIRDRDVRRDSYLGMDNYFNGRTTERDRDRERDREKEREREREREKERERDRLRDRTRDKEKERDRDKNVGDQRVREKDLELLRARELQERAARLDLYYAPLSVRDIPPSTLRWLEEREMRLRDSLLRGGEAFWRGSPFVFDPADAALLRREQELFEAERRRYLLLEEENRRRKSPERKCRSQENNPAPRDRDREPRTNNERSARDYADRGARDYPERYKREYPERSNREQGSAISANESSSRSGIRDDSKRSGNENISQRISRDLSDRGTKDYANNKGSKDLLSRINLKDAAVDRGVRSREKDTNDLLEILSSSRDKLERNARDLNSTEMKKRSRENDVQQNADKGTKKRAGEALLKPDVLTRKMPTKELETLWKDAVDIVKKGGFPFNISVINDKMRELYKHYQIRDTSFANFKSLCQHMEDINYCTITWGDQVSGVVDDIKITIKNRESQPETRFESHSLSPDRLSDKDEAEQLLEYEFSSEEDIDAANLGSDLVEIHAAEEL